MEKYDADDDGTITSEEILAVTEARAQASVDALLERFDKDDDGGLSEDEVLKSTRPQHSGWKWGHFRVR
jgi:Ca2+-binding EF-hand superfamily protein